MATVDRGGLDYEIKVTEDFASAFTRFRSEALSAKATWAAFKAELTQTRRDLAAAAQAQEVAAKQAERASRRSLQSQLNDEAALRRSLSQRLTLQKQFIKALDQPLRDVAGTLASLNKSLAALPRGVQNLSNLQAQLRNSAQRGGELLRTVRRVVEAVLVFQALRFGQTLFKTSITDGVKFNALIEDTVLGVQAILTAVGEVRDSQGQLITGAEAFAAAQKEARRQVNLIRVDSLRTTATFEQLAETFQTALAPGLSAGLNTDQVRQFAVRISQAAASIGLPQSQLSEEIRSLLQGTIQQRTTRIAAALGITNEDIRRAKEANTLADFLFKKFQSFEFSGQSALNNFSVLIQKLRDGVAQLLGEASVGFFNKLKTAATDALEALTVVTSKGVQINPEILRVVQALVSGLERAFDAAVRTVKALSLQQTLTIAQALGDALAFIGEVLVGTFLGAFRAIQDIIRLFELVRTAVSTIFAPLADAIPVKDTVEWAATLTEVAIIAATIFATFRGIQGAIGLFIRGLEIAASVSRILQTDIGALLGNLRAAGTQFAALAAPLLILVGLVVLLGSEIATGWISNIEIAGVRLGDAFASALNAALIAVQFVGKQIHLGFVTVWDVAGKAARAFFGFIDDQATEQEKTRNIQTLPADQAKIQNALLDKEREALRAQRELDESRFAAEFEAKSAKIKADFEEARADAKRVQDELAKGEKRPDVASVAAIRERFNALISGLGGAATAAKEIDLKPTTAEARNLANTFGEIPPSILGASEALRELDKLLKQVRDDQLKAKADLLVTQETAPFVGGAQDLVRVVAQGQAEVFKLSKQLRDAQAGATSQLIGINRELEIQKSKLAALSTVEQSAADRQAKLGELLIDLDRQRATIAQDISVQERDARLSAGAQTVDQRNAAQAELTAKRLILDELTKQRDEVLKTSQTELSSSGLSFEQQQNILALAQRRFELSQRAAGLEAEIKDLLGGQADLQKEVNGLTSIRVQQLAIQEAARLREENIALQNNIAVQRARAAAENPNLFRRDQEQLKLQADRLRLDLERALIIRNSGQELLAINARMALLDQESDEYRQLAALRDQVLAKQQLAIIENNVEVDALKVKQEELRKQAEEPFEFGATKALQDFLDKSLDSFSSTLQIMGDLLNGFSDLVANSVADALLSPDKAKSIEQRFDELMNNIAREIIQQIIRIQIAKLLISAGLGGAPVPGAAEGGVVGLAYGGRVPKSGRASLAHYFGRGYEEGGLGAPPPGVPASDTVPAWLTPGEYVVPVNRVRQYSVAGLEALRRGSIDPVAFRALAGSSLLSTAARARGRFGYAAGGSVGSIPSLSESLRSLPRSGPPKVVIVNARDKREFQTALAEERSGDIIINHGEARRSR